MSEIERYDYKHYWGSGQYQAERNPGWNAQIRAHLLPGSVLDLGCGSGRFTEAFDGHRYFGIDISPASIDIARTLYPDAEFMVGDITEFITDKMTWKNIFTWTTLEHIWPEKIEAVADYMKTHSRQIIIVEPLANDITWAGHCFKHDYHKLFNIIKEEPIEGNVHLMVAKGEIE